MSCKKPLKLALAISLVLALAAIPLLGSGCVGGGPGAAPSGIKVGFSICYTGVAAEKGRPMGNAKLDCMKYINEELGLVRLYLCQRNVPWANA